MCFKIVFGAVSVTGIVIVAIAAIVGWAILPNVIDKRIKEETKLAKGSETWDKWSNITLPIKLKFYIFHVRNPDEVELLGESPRLQEFGPYVYDEKRVKWAFEEKSDTVFYRQNITYTFNEEESYGPDSDTYDVINVAFLSVVNGVEDSEFGFAIGAIINYLYEEGERIILRGVSVRNLTFDGYDVTTYTENELISRFLTKEFDGGRFGLYKGKNGTDDGLYQINSGKVTPSYFGEIIEWEHKSQLGYWNASGPSLCDKINGSDGSIFPPFVTTDRVLRVFVVDMCRSLYLEYIGETKIRGIRGYAFSTPPSVLEDPRTNEWNRCFCLKENITDCEYSGVLEVGVCRSGAPIVMSTPHFLGANPIYQKDTGLQPNPDLHRTIMVLEPNSGVLLNARKRIQVNIRLRKYITDDTDAFAHVPELIFPILWAEETVDYDAENAEYLENKLLKPLKIVNIARWLVLGVGIFLAVIGPVLFALKKCTYKNKGVFVFNIIISVSLIILYMYNVALVLDEGDAFYMDAV